MKIERLKPYKSCDPFTTIEKIKKILHECGIYTIEEHFSISKSSLYSCSVLVANEELVDFKIGTNGKGISPMYSLASAYGEFMERFQNQWLFKFKDLAKYSSKKFLDKNSQYLFFKNFLEDQDLLLDFIYAPDEIFLSYEQLSEEQRKIYRTLFPYDDCDFKELINSSKTIELPWLPFYDLQNKSITHLPINLIHLNARTNGLCAGNTKEEAIIQGFAKDLKDLQFVKYFKKNYLHLQFRGMFLKEQVF